jgi:hypothetical protein
VSCRGKRPLRTISEFLHIIVIRSIVGLVVSAGVWIGGAHACSCAQISPDEGFNRAQYVFTGKVAEINGHTWTVDVDRVWKGADKLAKRVRLLDVYASIDCESYFELNRAYIFFAIVAKSSRYVYYQSEICNWTRALQSTRVATPHGAIWLEDLILERHGTGTAPTAEDPWEHRPTTTPTD